MKNQIELPFGGDRKFCRSARRSQRARWARVWFARMREVIEQAEEWPATNPEDENRPAPTPDPMKEIMETTLVAPQNQIT